MVPILDLRNRHGKSSKAVTNDNENMPEDSSAKRLDAQIYWLRKWNGISCIHIWQEKLKIVAGKAIVMDELAHA
ncbi:hypothetical protein Fmac_020475 [Flemingia macrophylla]|uniref:Uncharacterized protein n=1 Tax=Flemingia macrophylla TaxID=520843 RepID=A0ABD1LUR6_9FABA